MTTIQITDSTHQTLKQLKKNLDLPTYEDVIQWMLKITMEQNKSMYGVLGTKSMDEVLEGLRDEKDRM